MTDTHYLLMQYCSIISVATYVLIGWAWLIQWLAGMEPNLTLDSWLGKTLWLTVAASTIISQAFAFNPKLLF